MPADPDTITKDLLHLLEDGESVVKWTSKDKNGKDVDYHILDRKSLINPDWDMSWGITLVDFSSELLGLSTLWLP